MVKLSFKDSAFGWDGLTTFIFSTIILLLTFGLGFFWLLFKILNTAINTAIYTVIKGRITQPKTVLIAGLCLDKNQPVEEFKMRLKRVLELQHELNNDMRNDMRTAKLQVIILGGLTGANQISEAQAGADYLVARGMNGRQILLEEQSRHTLENLQQARILLLTEFDAIDENIALISSRYHLYRLLTLAKGLNLNLQPVAAEEDFKFSFLMWLKVMKEAYFLHWYWSGKLWVFITVNKKSKARIS